MFLNLALLLTIALDGLPPLASQPIASPPTQPIPPAIYPALKRLWYQPPTIAANYSQFRRFTGAYHVPRCTDNYARAGREPLFLTPVVPDPVFGLTTSGDPVVFIFIPPLNPQYQKVPNAGKMGDFTLRDLEDRNELYRVQVPLTGKAGILGIRIPLPSTSDKQGVKTPSRLKENQDYLWSFSVNCETDDPSTNPYVRGIIRRVQPPLSLLRKKRRTTINGYAAIYAEEGFWYDALATLAERRQKNPQKPIFEQQWSILLQSVQLQQISAYPLLD